MYKTHRAIYRKGQLNNSHDSTSAETKRDTAGDVCDIFASACRPVSSRHDSPLFITSAVNLRERIVLEVRKLCGALVLKTQTKRYQPIKSSVYIFTSKSKESHARTVLHRDVCWSHVGAENDTPWFNSCT